MLGSVLTKHKYAYIEGLKKTSPIPSSILLLFLISVQPLKEWWVT
jgi:hypothetical protein